MTAPSHAVVPAVTALEVIRFEAWEYAQRKPGRVPPADSPNRPALARIWRAAYLVAAKRRRVRTFTYEGNRFGVVYMGNQLCVMDLDTQRILVRPPTSSVVLKKVLGSQQGGT